MPSTNTMPIVGAFYRPPAKVLLSVLAIGTPLQLMAEPENEYDSNAVAVWLDTNELTQAMQDELETSEALASCGFSLAQILEQEQWHLGYIPKEMAAKIQSSLGSAPYPVTFSTSANGAPRVRSEQPFEI